MYYYDNKIYNHPTDCDKEVNEFLRRYEATAELSSRRYYSKRIPMNYRAWLNEGGNIPFHQEVEKQPMVEINIPQEHFQTLVEREKFYSSVEREADHYKKIVDQYREDERVRDKNPAVQKAWRNYITMLELAR